MQMQMVSLTTLVAAPSKAEVIFSNGKIEEKEAENHKNTFLQTLQARTYPQALQEEKLFRNLHQIINGTKK